MGITVDFFLHPDAQFKSIVIIFFLFIHIFLAQLALEIDMIGFFTFINISSFF